MVGYNVHIIITAQNKKTIMLDIYNSFISDVIEIGLRYSTVKDETKLETAKNAILKDREMYMEFIGLKKGYLSTLETMEITAIEFLDYEVYESVKEYIAKIKEFDI